MQKSPGEGYLAGSSPDRFPIVDICVGTLELISSERYLLLKLTWLSALLLSVLGVIDHIRLQNMSSSEVMALLGPYRIVDDQWELAKFLFIPFLSAVAVTNIHRFVLHHERPDSIVNFDLRGDTFRVFLLILAGSVAMWGAEFSMIASSRFGALDSEIHTLIYFIATFAVVLLVGYAAVRLSVVLPETVASGSIRVHEALRLTEKSFWRLFALAAIVFVVVVGVVRLIGLIVQIFQMESSEGDLIGQAALLLGGFGYYTVAIIVDVCALSLAYIWFDQHRRNEPVLQQSETSES